MRTNLSIITPTPTNTQRGFIRNYKTLVASLVVDYLGKRIIYTSLKFIAKTMPTFVTPMSIPLLRGFRPSDLIFYVCMTLIKFRFPFHFTPINCGILNISNFFFTFAKTISRNIFCTVLYIL